MWCNGNTRGFDPLVGSSTLPIPSILKIMKEYLYWLNTTYCCGGIVINERNVIIDSCPLYKWMRGKTLKYVIKYLDKKGKLKQYRKVGA